MFAGTTQLSNRAGTVCRLTSALTATEVPAANSVARSGLRTGSLWERGRSELAINEMIKLRRGRLKCPHISFNPKPEAMAGDARGPSTLLAAIAFGFGLN
jgi:hypothetical protein